jgi:hypothetical protein
MAGIAASTGGIGSAIDRSPTTVSGRRIDPGLAARGRGFVCGDIRSFALGHRAQPWSCLRPDIVAAISSPAKCMGRGPAIQRQIRAIGKVPHKSRAIISSSLPMGRILHGINRPYQTKHRGHHGHCCECETKVFDQIGYKRHGPAHPDAVKPNRKKASTEISAAAALQSASKSVGGTMQG